MRDLITVLSTVVCGFNAITAAQALSPEPLDHPGSIRGYVFDDQHSPTPGVSVILCDAVSGVPVNLNDWQPFPQAESSISDRMRDIATSVTDEHGAFSFDQVDPGDYRLITQSWPDSPNTVDPLGVNGITVRLHGVSEPFTLDSEETESHELTPLGSCTLIIEDLASNDETLIVVSTEPLGADPILGFAGWTGPFMQQMLGGNRMPEGKTTFLGLPEGAVHLATFSADNIPGYGTASVTLEPDQPMVVDIPFVVTWSDGVHSPPPQLEALTTKIAAGGDPLVQKIMSVYRGELSPGQNPLFAMAHLSLRSELEFEFPDGTKEPLSRVATALAYVMMHRSLERSGREPNPYRAATTRPALPDELPAEHLGP